MEKELIDRIDKTLEKAFAEPKFLEIRLGQTDYIKQEHDGMAMWYDWHGVTYGDFYTQETVLYYEAQNFISLWVTCEISRQLGYTVEWVCENDGNGHCYLWFKRKVL